MPFRLPALVPARPVLLLAALLACAGPPAEEPLAGPGGLAGTHWRLVEIQSMDDAIGTARPDDPSKYTLALGADGTATLRIDCNRGRGPWEAVPPDAESGSFRIGPLALTRAMCHPPDLGDRVARELAFVRGYLRRDGRLYLSLMADGGIHVWEPDPQGGASGPGGLALGGGDGQGMRAPR